MHRKPMQSEGLVRGSLSHHLLADAGITELVLPFLRFFGKPERFKPLFTPCRAEGKGSCITSTLCPERADRFCHRRLEMQHQCFFRGFLVFFARFFFGLGYQLFCLARHTLVKTFSEPPIFKSMPFPKRALWLAGFPIVNLRNSFRPSLEPQ